jgi:hypothetical protein
VTPILLVLNKRLQVGGPDARQPQPIWQSPPSIVSSEEYFLYYIPRRVQQ